jgi:hypothetical protein
MRKGMNFLAGVRRKAFGISAYALKEPMMRFGFLGMVFLCSTAQAATHQDWVVSHQPDRFMDRVLMEAWADADQGPARMTLYCDTENGFRVMFLPHRALVPEGPSLITLKIDNGRPVTLNGDAFGDDDTDVVTVYGTAKVQRALASAHQVSVHFLGGDGKTGDDNFTFGDLAAQRDKVMKVCPVR